MGCPAPRPTSGAGAVMTMTTFKIKDRVRVIKLPERDATFVGRAGVVLADLGPSMYVPDANWLQVHLTNGVDVQLLDTELELEEAQ